MDTLRVEFHCHTIFSKDSLTKPERLVSAARQKSRALILRVRFRDLSSTSPLSVASTSGISALGSPCAAEPQSVPRLRV